MELRLGDDRRRLATAALLAVAGIAAALFSLLQVSLPKRSIPKLALPEEIRSRSILEPASITFEPTPDNVSDCLAEVGNSVSRREKDLKRLGFSSRQLRDLQSAIVARIESVLLPNFTRDFVEAKNRGLSLSRERALTRFEQSEDLFNWLQLSPLGPDHLEIIVHRSPSGATSEKMNGYVMLQTDLSNESSFPKPAMGAFFVEACIPVLSRTIPQASQDKTQVVLLGFRYFWSMSREQWIPMSTKTYTKLSVGGPPRNAVPSIPNSF